MLPSVPEKVEHFLSAYLGLADKRRWQGKVDAKLQAVKTAIARLADPQEKGDKEKGHKEKGDTAQRRVRAQSLS